MKKRLLALLLSTVMTVSMLAGCGGGSSDSKEAASESSSEDAGDTSEEVNLTMYVVSDRPAGQDVVDENLNKLLKEKLNCTLTINWIAWSDYSNKYPLLFSSGEEFDMAYCATWLNYKSLAQKGAFMNLDELWEEYAPNNYAATSEAAKQQATVNGSYYCIPTQLATYHGYGPIYRPDLLEGTDWDGEMENFEDLEEYMDLVKETHPEVEPLEMYQTGSEVDDLYMWSLGYNSSTGTSGDFLFYDPTDENPQLFTYYEADEVNDFLEMMNRWNEKGFFSKSALSDTDSTKFQNGKAAVKIHHLDDMANYHSLQPTWGVQFSNFVKYMNHLPYTQDVMVISNTAKNPERALQLWDLITTDQEVFDAFYYGVLGETYELNEEGQYTILNTDLYSTSAMWAARTSELNRDGAGTPESYGEWKDTFEEMIAADDTSERYAAFSLDTSNIETEYAACLNVHQQYWWPLELGYTDMEEGLANYQSKMEAAGIEKVREEFQKQLDAYVAGLE